MGVALIHTSERQAKWRTDTTKLIVALQGYTNSPKTGLVFNLYISLVIFVALSTFFSASWVPNFGVYNDYFSVLILKWSKTLTQNNCMHRPQCMLSYPNVNICPRGSFKCFDLNFLSVICDKQTCPLSIMNIKM